MSPPVVEVWSDPHCPYAYLLRHRLEHLPSSLTSQLRFRPRCLAIEVDTRRPTPKAILDNETPLILLQGDDVPYEPWPEALLSDWPTTFLPAMEALKAVERLDAEAAWRLDLRLREAFFAEHACLTQRHVLADLAEEVGVDREAFLKVWDSGETKGEVLSETMEGWYERDFQASPTLVLPDGSVHTNPAGPKVELDPDRRYRLVGFEPGPEDPMGALVALLEEALA